MRRLLKIIALVIATLVVVTVAGVYLVLRASLPPVEGALSEPTLSAPVTIERDSLGVPTITANTRSDLAYGTGFVHGQDRFFQMDLSRRLSAGELSEIFGDAALKQDRNARLFRFRHVATQVLEQTSPEEKEILAAYTRGVNAGLNSLGSRPWEYWLLREQPRAWTEIDTILVVHAMWWDLQYRGFQREKLRRVVNSKLSGPDCGFGWKCSLQYLYPGSTKWDSPNITGEPVITVPGVSLPIPPELNIRTKANVTVVQNTDATSPRDRIPPVVGSNSWAVAGSLTATGAALVANDMHLGLRIPTTWYRVRLRMPAQGDTAALDLNGLTLAGTPTISTGSNGHIAWGFTNSYGDWLDLERFSCTEVTDSVLKTPQGEVPLTTVNEVIHVKGAADDVLAVRNGLPGVLFEENPAAKSCRFARWLAAVPAATNIHLMRFERVSSVQEAVDLAPEIGVPHQNLVVGDREGHIGWTVIGRIPASVGDDRMSGRGAWLTQDAHPNIIDPPNGRLWTANTRPVDNLEYQAAIGGDEAFIGAEYNLGARAGQIRNGLERLRGPATPADMLGIQLDDRALFLTQWRELLLTLLDEAALEGRPDLEAFRTLVVEWTARASADSVGYRMVRAFHDQVEVGVWDMIMEGLNISKERPDVPPQFEGPLWEIVTTRPEPLLARQYANWREFLLAQVDLTLTDLRKSCADLKRCTWGSHDPVAIRHPLSAALPVGASLFDMKTLELPGDRDMPRVQDGSFGASERFAVSPGHEAEGYIHLPGGQSGHPLSPWYRAGFDAWASGKALPFLPGPAQHSLTLAPPPASP